MKKLHDFMWKVFETMPLEVLLMKLASDTKRLNDILSKKILGEVRDHAEKMLSMSCMAVLFKLSGLKAEEVMNEINKGNDALRLFNSITNNN